MNLRTIKLSLWLATLITAVSFECWSAEAPRESAPAPALSATLLDGTQFSLAAQSGKVVIINFWATWCAPCWAEMPALEEYYRRHRAQGLEVIAISVDDPRDVSKVREVMQKFTFPAAMLNESRAADYGQVSRVPLTFVVNHRGVLVRDGRRGKATIDLPTLEWSVTPYLPGPPAAVKTGG